MPIVHAGVGEQVTWLSSTNRADSMNTSVAIYAWHFECQLIVGHAEEFLDNLRHVVYVYSQTWNISTPWLLVVSWTHEMFQTNTTDRVKAPSVMTTLTMRDVTLCSAFVLHISLVFKFWIEADSSQGVWKKFLNQFEGCPACTKPNSGFDVKQRFWTCSKTETYSLLSES